MNISRSTFGNVFSSMKTAVLWSIVYWILFPKTPIDNTCVLVKVTVGCLFGAKPLSIPTSTNFHDTNVTDSNNIWTVKMIEWLLLDGQIDRRTECGVLTCVLARLAWLSYWLIDHLSFWSANRSSIQKIERWFKYQATPSSDAIIDRVRLKCNQMTKKISHITMTLFRLFTSQPNVNQWELPDFEWLLFVYAIKTLSG